MNQSMTSLPESLTQASELDVEAIYLGHRIKWNSQLPWQIVDTNPLTILVNNNSCAVLFRHGAVVLFNLHREQRDRFLDELGSLISEPLPKIECETVKIRVDHEQKEGADFETLLLHQVDVARLQLVADVLAKSTIMAYYEQQITAQFDRIEPIAADIHLGWRASHQARVLLKHIGETLLVESRMVGRAEIMDKPELVWENPELDRLYHRLEEEYEISERFEALQHKLGLIMRTADTELNLLHHRRSLRVEWYIVILIVVDILISLFLK